MSMGLTMTEEARPAPANTPRINDVAITVATANGTGSQSANNVLVRAIFEMGIPVGAKNLFPSNIAGMPTWYDIRVSKDGWTARKKDADIVVLMNPDSVKDDLAAARPGAIVIAREELAEEVRQRTDIEVILVPFTKLIEEVCEVPRLRKLVVNIMVVGVLAWLLDAEMEMIDLGIEKQFAGKTKAADMNKKAAAHAYGWARENLKPLAGYRLERMGDPAGKIIIDGNTACSLGAIWGGVTVVGWYPITPSTSIIENLIDLLPKLRRDPATGKATYAVVQAEDELAAIGVILGAGWAGARSFTTTSGPGMSLMAEQAGLSYYTEIPTVIVNVQRMGPSTGLPTRTCQGDMSKAYYLSHGDAKHILLIPGSIEECFDMTVEAFNYAERYQTLVWVMIDLDYGMNLWVSEPFKYPENPINRGKVLTAEELAKLGDGWGRYKDLDGDGIPYRTVPGTRNPKASYFLRGTGHNEQAKYSEKPEVWKANMDRLARKFETARRELPAPVIEEQAGAEIAIIAYGSSDLAAREAVAMLAGQAGDKGKKVSYLRLRALPAHPQALEFIQRHARVYVVDQNRDAQVAGILRSEWPEVSTRIRSVLHYNGTSIDAQTIAHQILAQEGK